MLEVIDKFLLNNLKAESIQIERAFRAPYEKSLLAIVCGAKEGTAESLTCLKELKEKGYFITIIPTEAGGRMWGNYIAATNIGSKYITNYENVDAQSIAEANCALIMAGLTVNTMAKISAAHFDSAPLYLVYQFLLNAQNIFATQEGILKAPANGEKFGAANRELASVIEAKLKLTEKMGLKYLTNQEIYQSFCLEAAMQTGSNKPIGAIFGKNVLSISDLLKEEQGSVFKIKKSTVVTPSARDYAKAKQINIEVV